MTWNTPWRALATDLMTRPTPPTHHTPGTTTTATHPGPRHTSPHTTATWTLTQPHGHGWWATPTDHTAHQITHDLRHTPMHRLVAGTPQAWIADAILTPPQEHP